MNGFKVERDFFSLEKEEGREGNHFPHIVLIIRSQMFMALYIGIATTNFSCNILIPEITKVCLTIRESRKKKLMMDRLLYSNRSIEKKKKKFGVCKPIAMRQSTF